MASTRTKINGREIQKYLDGGNGVEALLQRSAQRVLAAAKADPHDDTYAYENGLHIVTDNTDRMVVRVVSGDFKGHILEARYGILARAMDSV